MNAIAPGVALTPIEDPANGDLVVTVPKGLWAEWLAEGCIDGEQDTGGWDYHFTLGRKPPDWVTPGARVFIVSHGRLRGFAPLHEVARWDERRWSLVRRGGAIACTIPAEIQGFRGLRRRWFSLSDLTEFPDWQTTGVT